MDRRLVVHRYSYTSRCYFVIFISRSEEFSNENAPPQSCDQQQPQPQQPQQQGLHPPSNVVVASETEESTLVEGIIDLTPRMELKVSSRVAMVGSLNDNSTETFWESCDEDRNKSKWVTASLGGGGGAGLGGLKPDPGGIRIKSSSVHIDNGRDIGNKVSHLIFKGSRNADSNSDHAGAGMASNNAGAASAAASNAAASNDLVTLKQFDVDSRFAGWVTCFIDQVRNFFVFVYLPRLLIPTFKCKKIITYF